MAIAQKWRGWMKNDVDRRRGIMTRIEKSDVDLRQFTIGGED